MRRFVPVHATVIAPPGPHLLAALFLLALMLLALPVRAEITGEPRLLRLDEAGTGELLLFTTEPGQYLPAIAVATDIRVTVSGPIARTRITQRFENPSDRWVEGIYVYPLPEGSAVDMLHMLIGERVIEGQIKERAEARALYEQAKADGKKTALMEQERPNVFTNSVANIGPHETVVVQIEYQEPLRLDEGAMHLRLPLVVAPRYSPPPQVTIVDFDETGMWGEAADPVPDRDRLEAPVLRPEAGPVNPVTIAVQLDAGFPLGAVTSTHHAVTVTRQGDSAASITLSRSAVPADRDFELVWRPVAGTEPTAALLKETLDGVDYVLALVVPPTGETAPVVQPREVIFVLDTSGSMGGESIRQAKASLLLALKSLRAGDRFNVIRFSSDMSTLYAAPVDATAEKVRRAEGYVAGLDAEGGTEMLLALEEALIDPTPDDRTRLRQVVFLTDGAVGNEDQLFAAIERDLGRSRLFTVGIGSAPNSYFMSGAARLGRGTFSYIGSEDEVAARMAELFGKLESPVMTDLDARWSGEGAIEAFPDPLPDLYAREPVVVALRLPKATGTLTLAGRRGEQPWQAILDLDDARPGAGIAKLWARSKIAALEERRITGEDPAAIDAGVLDTSLAFHLVSRLTSLVAIDVTPSRPADASLMSGKVPLNLPAGWDFDKVFGETVPMRDANAGTHDTASAGGTTSTDASGAFLAKLQPSTPPASQENLVVSQSTALALPQTATTAELALLLGVALSCSGAVVLIMTARRRLRAA